MTTAPGTLGSTPPHTSDGAPPYTSATTPPRFPTRREAAPAAPAGAAPPRSPGSGRTRPPAAGGRPPASARARASRTRPSDTRPPTPSATRTAPRRTSGTATTPAHTDAAASAPAEAGTAPAHAGPAHHVPTRGSLPAAIPQPLPTDVFADLLVAVLSGHRPVHSMLRHTRGRAYDELAWLAERGPLRTRGARPVVRDIGYYEPRPGAIEAFARVGAGDRLRAMAFRLELGRDRRWRCTAVELGGPRPPRPEAD
ncbi:Rv3235 family protein [Streptomyces violaceochromogenes]|uniref:Rv3235 family protein n=1 Tax=Streptomyces violaceochromogenes TaxID=67377 RepID=A0ABU6LXU9_9ACTN|nr:Rv3235 family protein [Streptomyces violaceochromogenes]MEC7054343.1 Rv3235 family protein [Streptomyces violaceochromogenes]GHC64518.1 hypothetical protein GCM10010309_27910 [Streptomyces violaceochromogenes]